MVTTTAVGVVHADEQDLGRVGHGDSLGAGCSRPAGRGNTDIAAGSGLL
jgi:hypothetical protein